MQPPFPPSRVGDCSDSLVLSKRFRMVPSPGDQDYQRTTDPFGKEVIFSLTKGLHLYSGEGDDRGKRYRVVDLQSGGSS